MSIDALLLKAVIKALDELYDGSAPDNQIQIQETRKDFEGDRTLVVFPLLRVSRKKPEETGEEIGAWLLENLDEVSDFNVVKGFLNLSIDASYWLSHLAAALDDAKYGHAASTGQTTMLEYSSPNTNKPLHLGHIRNNLLGYSVAKILEANGHKVIKCQIINDRGIHICKSMLAWQKYGGGTTPESTEIKGDKFVGNYYVRFDKEYKAQIRELVAGGMEAEQAERQAPLMLEAKEMLRKWEAGDPDVTELWRTMNGWVYEGFEVTYKTMGVAFDHLYYESNTWLLGKELVLKGVEEGIFYQKEDGSVWVDLEDEGLDHKLLLRSDGTAVYMTQDIGTAILRSQDYPAASSFIYTVGNEQDYHFKVLFLSLKKLGYDWWSNCHHLSYGMVELPHGKMKSREGTVVDADDLMEGMFEEAAGSADRERIAEMPEAEQQDLFRMIGLGALKYFILKVDPKKKMLFDPAESIALQGNTGPFIQYTHARIQSVLRLVGQPDSGAISYWDIDAIETNLLKAIYRYPEVVREAGESMAPALIANYVYALADEYNSYFQNMQPRIKDDSEPERKNFRLALTKMVGKVLKSGMDLLGVQVPDRM